MLGRTHEECAFLTYVCVRAETDTKYSVVMVWKGLTWSISAWVAQEESTRQNAARGIFEHCVLTCLPHCLVVALPPCLIDV